MSLHRSTVSTKVGAMLCFRICLQALLSWLERINLGWYWKTYLRSLEKKFTFPGKNIYSHWKRNLGSSGPVVLWSSGPVVLWSCGPLVLWFSGPVVLWSSVLWCSGPVVLRSCGRVVLWSSGPKNSMTASESRSMFCKCIWGGGAAPSPPTPSSQVQVECLNFFSRVLNFFSRG